VLQIIIKNIYDYNKDKKDDDKIKIRILKLYNSFYNNNEDLIISESYDKKLYNNLFKKTFKKKFG